MYIPILDITKICMYSTIVIMGDKNLPKSYFLKNIFKNKDHSALIISNNDERRNFFSRNIKNSIIYSEYNPDEVKSFLNVQKNKILQEVLQDSYQPRDVRTIENNVSIIFDDTNYKIQNTCKYIDEINNPIIDVIKNGNSFNIFYVQMVDNIINFDFKTDYIFIFEISSLEEKRNLFEKHAYKYIADFDFFCTILKVYTKYFNGLVIKLSEPSPGIYHYKSVIN
jgi:hypothetical protein